MVVILFAVIASLALQNYRKMIEQAYCRNAQMNLLRIYSASLVREVKNTSSVQKDNLSDINAELEINIADDPNFEYYYRYINPTTPWSAGAVRTIGPPFYRCSITPPSQITCDSEEFCPVVIPP